MYSIKKCSWYDNPTTVHEFRLQFVADAFCAMLNMFNMDPEVKFVVM